MRPLGLAHRTVFIVLVCIFVTVRCTELGPGEFDAIFREQTLGLELSQELFVTGFGKKGATSKGNVHVGDRIVAVNGRSLEGLSGAAASSLIRSAQIPRTLRFRSTVRNADRIMVEIPDPAIIETKEHVQVLTAKGVAARLPFATSLFGPTKSVNVGGTGQFEMPPATGFDWCDPHEIAFADPRDACGAFKNEELLRGKVVVVHRGTCSFVTKAWLLQAAGAKAMVLINFDGSLFRMPQGDQDTIGLQLASFMLQLDALVAIEPLVLQPETARTLKVRFINPTVCKDLNATTEAILQNSQSYSVGADGSVRHDGIARPAEPKSYAHLFGGKLTVSGKNRRKELAEFLQFETGSKTLPASATLVASAPANACGEVTRVPVNAWVLVDRGGCSFHDKLRNAAAAGAGGVLIVNDMPGLVHGKGIPSGTTVDSDDGTHTPAAMVTLSFGRTLRTQVGLPAVVQFKSDPHVVRRWNALAELETNSAWPEDKSERKALYKALSMQNHPDKDGGNADRFSYLQMLYQAVDGGNDIRREGLV